MKSSKNYYWIRERADSTVEWLRPGALAKDIARPLVLVLGTWDLLHFGHMRVLFAAREKATDQGTVICGMYSDQALKKQAKVPVLGWVERATALQYMPIDYIVEVDSQKDIHALAEQVVPDIVITEASDERWSKWPGIRRALVRSAGMTTQEIINRCLEQHQRQERERQRGLSTLPQGERE